MHHTNRIYCLELLEHWKLIQFKIQQNNIDRKKTKEKERKNTFISCGNDYFKTKPDGNAVALEIL